MKRVIFNQKGGVGKTSITCNLAAAFATLGRRVLVIDLDSQANTSQYLLGEHRKDTIPSIVNFFESTLSFKLFKGALENAITVTPFENLWLIPAKQSLSDIQTKLESRYKILKLSQAIDNLLAKRVFDDVFIDTPPAMNFYTMSALIAADSVLIPFDCDAFSARAILQVMETIEDISYDYKPGLSIEGVVINHFQSTAKFPQETIQTLLSTKIKILKPYLSSSVIIKESHNKNKPVVYLKPKHKLAQQYLSLAKSLSTKKRSDKTFKINKLDEKEITR